MAKGFLYYNLSLTLEYKQIFIRATYIYTLKYFEVIISYFWLSNGFKYQSMCPYIVCVLGQNKTNFRVSISVMGNLQSWGREQVGILYGREKKTFMRNFIVYLKIIATVFTMIICVKDFL